ncbi:sigma-70 family RNA polymerase sigma factor [Methylobacterium oxalidis]|uniref:DNA-directed RNA polymerase sigma-70 factor n=1 Tax=Methylobacterium oxalidis TaxID=944322 RepID=A0A512J5I5_9HYPH|nr:sigma-70 family RNA polymerase sigma factor [Methylobacterium oxalidis]GEP05236.1 DNA-directed RNA polymerase sigma-70 factor [Methylobacterium oxalidis]GJE34235.1 ECF RNA polymerase sigma factor SigJ [Methylobacterium oxalidis]GLS66346.1 DNA-directed RNA polymerase sigma-70 factor [Methylobacterium oxalidis]
MRPDPATDAFEAERPRLLRLAYRMLGSVAEAEDVVQNAWLRWREADRASVRIPAAFLSRIVTRLCLDAMKTARARRETYVGTWLPEPLLESVEEEAVDSDDLTLTLMLALERLSPLERAAFLLHDVFGMPLGDVAATLDRDAAAIRQLAVRARRHVQADRPRYPVAPQRGEAIARAFFDASRGGDVAALRAMLAEDAVMRSDGGGKVLAFLNPIHGVDRILRLFSGLARKHGAAPATFLRAVTVDGLPGFASLERGGVLQVTALAVEQDRIVGIYITRNPDKLGHVADLLDLPAAPMPG